jgi:hypothetical protein
MLRKSHTGWTSQDIHELFDAIVEEYCLLSEGSRKERIIEITDDTDQVIPMTDRIMERYTIVHISYYSESVNDDFAEDMEPREVE